MFGLNPTAIKILEYLHNERNNGLKYGTVITKRTNTTFFCVIENLRILREKGLVERDEKFNRVKRKKFYKLTKKGEEVANLIVKLRLLMRENGLGN